MQIEISSKSAIIEGDILIKKALKFRANRKKAFSNKKIKAKDCKFEGIFYYPYWIGQVYTSKERMNFNPKELHFEVVCDAIDETYIVLRNIPKTEKIECADNAVLPFSLKLEDFKNRIIEDAKVTRNNKQFIFGKPFSSTERCKMIYIPGGVIQVVDNMTNEREKFYINAYTGEVKKI